MPDGPNRYEAAWQSFWSTLTGEPGEVLWNVTPDLAAGLDFKHFQDLFASNKLPMIDVGCGDGTQTQFFAQHMQHVMGVDVSLAVIEAAQAQYASAKVEYRILDLMNTAACQALHAEVGDANLYMRGVLMQFSPSDRIIAVKNLNLLMGAKGYLYLNEYPPETKAYYGSIFEKQGMADGFARVLKHGITPGGISAEDINTLFPSTKFEIARQGEHVMNTVIPLEDGGFAQAPAFYLVVKAL